MAGPLNYTTKVPSSRTLAEVSQLLAEHGADAVAATYADRRVSGIRFQFGGNTYDLPADTTAMLAVLRAADGAGQLKGSAPDRKRWTTPEHAERVTWRVIKDWLEAQLALVAAEQITLGEVMLPYVMLETGRTLREQWRERLALPAPPT